MDHRFEKREGMRQRWVIPAGGWMRVHAEAEADVIVRCVILGRRVESSAGRLHDFGVGGLVGTSVLLEIDNQVEEPNTVSYRVTRMVCQ